MACDRPSSRGGRARGLPPRSAQASIRVSSRPPGLSLIRVSTPPTSPPLSYEEAIGAPPTPERFAHDLSSAAVRHLLQWPEYRNEIRHHPHLIPAGYEDNNSEEENCRAQ